MNFTKSVLLFALIPLILCQSGYNKNFATAARKMKEQVSQRSLIGKWRLLQDSNFVLNKKVQMINEVPNQRLRTNEKLSFISSANQIREAEAYFDSEKEGGQPKTLYIELYDGKYYSNNTVAIQIDLTSMEPSQRSDNNINLWSTSKSMIVICMLVRDKEVMAKVSVHAKLEIYTNAKQDQIANEETRFNIKFQSSSFSFYSEMQYISSEYNKLATVQGIYTLLFLFAVIKFKPKKSVYNISEWMILQAFVFVLVSSWMFLRFSLQKIDTKLRFVGLCAFINVCLAFFFLRNYEQVLKSFKQKSQKILAGAGIFAYLILCYFFENSINFWIFESFCLLVLQIYYSYEVGGRGGLSIYLVATLLFMRFPYFYYQFYCPEITREPVNYQKFGTFLIVNAILLCFITIQRYFGSRFMIPKELIPDYFNYFQRYNKGHDVLEEVCPICTFKLKENSPTNHQEMEDSDEENQDKVPQHEQSAASAPVAADSQNLTVVVIMKTTCGHMYHSTCLQEWIQKRLICPLCRTPLPPSEKQRDDSYCC